MDRAEVIEILKRYKELLSKQMNFESSILFGSCTKGGQREDSDIDVAVVVDEMSGDYFETRPILWKISREVDDRIEPLILERKHDDSGFLTEVMRSGVLIE
jgi:predicted nucleotidyltransferase